MKKLKTFLPLFFFIFLLSASCEKKRDDIESIPANIRFKVVDREGKGIEGMTVFIKLRNQTLVQMTTGEDGQTAFRKMYKGEEYFAEISFTENDMEYFESKEFDVKEGEKTTVVLDPTHNVGNLTITLKRKNNKLEELLPNVKVCLTETDYLSSLDLAEVISKSKFKGTTGVNGSVKFYDIPAQKNLYILPYDDENKAYSIEGERFAKTKKGTIVLKDIIIK